MGYSGYATHSSFTVYHERNLNACLARTIALSRRWTCQNCSPHRKVCYQFTYQGRRTASSLTALPRPAFKEGTAIFPENINLWKNEFSRKAGVGLTSEDVQNYASNDGQSLLEGVPSSKDPYDFCGHLVVGRVVGRCCALDGQCKRIFKETTTRTARAFAIIWALSCWSANTRRKPA